jgi:uncharacterized membrane protein YtjA (UPF0391 family)
MEAADMRALPVLLFFAAVVSGGVGFLGPNESAAEWMQILFFVFLIASVACLVWDRRRPI